MKEDEIIHRPWGGYSILKKSGGYWVKKLFVKKNARLSLQSHELRDEVWYVLDGKICAWVSGKKIEAAKGETVFVPKKCKHRIEGLEESCILEVAFGRVLERDITRYEDDYGRGQNQSP